MSLVTQLLILCPLVFGAGFVDSIAGGGGLISLPAYLLVGLPAHSALASNKFSSSIGTTFSAGRYFINGVLDVKVAILSAIAAFLGSAVGARLALFLEDEALRIFMIAALPVAAVVMLMKRNYGNENHVDTLTKTRTVILALVIGMVIGMYDGVYGPGTGTFAIIAYTLMMRYDLRTASGNAKALNLASNYAAVITFMLAGTVDYRLAIPGAACAIAGHLIGSGLAIKKGVKFIRPMMILVLALLMGKMIYDLIVG